MTTGNTTVTQADRIASDNAFDIAFRGDTDGIDTAMASLFARHRIEATRELEAEVERLRVAIKRQANAVRSLQINEQTEINSLRRGRREAHVAIRTLDSERQANEILTDEVHTLKAQLAEARGLLERAMSLAIPYPDWKSDAAPSSPAPEGQSDE